MKSSVTLSPDSVPVLSRGRHRTPRRGACFMEFASFLAGERWSDRPSCTDASLAHLARGVNDLVSDTARGRLAVLIPSVIGLTDAGDRMSLIVAVLAGCAALPVASETRQRTIAVGLQHLGENMPRTEAGETESLRSDIRRALDLAPSADAWALAFRANVGPRALTDIDTITRTLTSVALVGIADACIPDADTMLIALLDRAITTCAALVTPVDLSRTGDLAYATA